MQRPREYGYTDALYLGNETKQRGGKIFSLKLWFEFVILQAVHQHFSTVSAGRGRDKCPKLSALYPLGETSLSLHPRRKRLQHLSWVSQARVGRVIPGSTSSCCRRLSR